MRLTGRDTDDSRQTATKRCATCGETKPLEDFSPHPRSRDGRNAACKACRVAGGKTAAGSKKRYAVIAETPTAEFLPVETLSTPKVKQAKVTAEPNAPKSVRSILEEALRIRSGERNVDYGDAVENFERIADIVAAISGVCIPPDLCCLVHIATKLSRERHNHKEDNLIDLCGYADILNRIRAKYADDQQKEVPPVA